MKLIAGRHCESVWNRKGIIQGQRDSPLTTLGPRQVTVLSLALADTEVRHIYSSPAIRAVESARQLAQEFQCQVTTAACLHGRH
jgi:probable phosphoglycerate mutase